MAQPTSRITSPQAAVAAARGLETPSDVVRFVELAVESPSVRAFLRTPEWAEIRERIMGDGTPPLGRLTSLPELARLFRWTADGAFSEEALSAEARRAYLHAAAEVDAFERAARRLSSVPRPPADESTAA